MRDFLLEIDVVCRDIALIREWRDRTKSDIKVTRKYQTRKIRELKWADMRKCGVCLVGCVQLTSHPGRAILVRSSAVLTPANVPKIDV